MGACAGSKKQPQSLVGQAEGNYQQTPVKANLKKLTEEQVIQKRQEMKQHLKQSNPEPPSVHMPKLLPVSSIQD